jgi:phage FluMu gp28-like protein
MKNNSLLNYQQRWVSDRSPLKVMAQSRQIGMTWATAREAVEVAGSPDSEGGMDVYYTAISEDDARLFADYCSEWIGELLAVLQIQLDTIDAHLEQARRLVAIPRRARIAQDVSVTEIHFLDKDNRPVRVFRIVLASGFAINSMAGPALVRGKGGYHIIAEAAWQELEERTRACSGSLVWGGRAAILGSYRDGTDNEFYKYVQQVKAGEREASLHEVFIHAALSDGLFKRICEVRRLEWSEEAEATWLEGMRRFSGSTFAAEFEGMPSETPSGRNGGSGGRGGKVGGGG